MSISSFFIWVCLLLSFWVQGILLLSFLHRNIDQLNPWAFSIFVLCTDIYLFFRLANHVDCVPRYLKYVVDMGIYLYGPTYPSINVHSLLHIVDDYQVKKPFLVHLKEDWSSRISVKTLHSKMAMPDSQQYPLNLYQIINVEDIVIFLDSKVFINSECSEKSKITFIKKPRFKIISFQNYKHGYLIHNSDKLLRVLLWIRQCHLCMECHVKFHLSSP